MPFEFTSLTISNPPSTQPILLSMTAVLPQINFGFDELKNRMARFTVGFDEFIDKGQKRIMEERNEFAKTVVEDKDTQRMLKKEIDLYKQKENDVAEVVTKEEKEAAEAENAIADMANKRQSKQEQRTHLLSQIEEIGASIRKKREIRVAERKELASQTSRNAPELQFWEDYLGMRIEGAGVPDHLKILFTHIIDSDWTKEFYFVINMVTRDYQVIHCKPILERNKVRVVADRLNETRDFPLFLKEMRNLFKERALGGD